MAFDRRPAELEAPAANALAMPWDRDRQRALYPARADVLQQAPQILTDTGSDPKARDFNNRIATLPDRWIMPFRARSRDKVVQGVSEATHQAMKTSYDTYIEQETRPLTSLLSG